MIKKLKSRAGLTLTELLVTLLIMAMFSSACLVGISTAFRARQDNIKANDADILASIVTQLITDELRLSDDAVVSADSVTYTSHASGYGSVKLYVDESDGHLYMDIGNEGSATKQAMLNEAAYSSVKLRFNPLIFEVVDKSIKVTLEVTDADGKPLKTQDFFVQPLNPLS